LAVTVSQALGFLVSAGSALVKLPQLFSILRSGSVAGVSLEMYGLEVFSQVVAILYHRAHGFPLATYGENITLGGGNLAILAAFAAMERSASRRGAAMLSLALPLLMAPLLRFPRLLAALQSMAIPMNIAAKLPQIRINQRVIAQLHAEEKRIRRANWATAQSQSQHGASNSSSTSNLDGEEGNVTLRTPPSGALLPSGASAATTVAVARTMPAYPAGLRALPVAGGASGASAPSSSSAASSTTSPPQKASTLSAVPFALNLAGSISRLYTTVAQLQGDRLMLLSFAVSIALNAAIVWQCRRIAQLQLQCDRAAKEDSPPPPSPPHQEADASPR